MLAALLAVSLLTATAAAQEAAVPEEAAHGSS